MEWLSVLQTYNKFFQISNYLSPKNITSNVLGINKVVMSAQCVSMLKDGDVLLCGYYKKLKTLKRKFFVLYNETTYNSARIEYYDNEKKYRSGFAPKRVIKLKDCFNINRRLYAKHEFVIVLSLKEGGFGIVMDSEDEINAWLNQLLRLRKAMGTHLEFPKFDYVWQVVIQRKGIAEQHNISGDYHICLSSKSISFIRIMRGKFLGDKSLTGIAVSLTTIRRCGDSQCYFYMEIGRQCSLGPGELWMETEDSTTAQDMHRMILSKMVSLNEAIIEPMRRRSSSATETSNPLTENVPLQHLDVKNNCIQNVQNFIRDQSDTLPSRDRASSESSSHGVKTLPSSSGLHAINFQIHYAPPISYSASEDSISVDDSKERMGIPVLLSSEPSEVIPEEYITEQLNATPFTKLDNYGYSDIVATSMDSVSKSNKNLSRLYCISDQQNIKTDICSKLDGRLYQSLRAYSVGNKSEGDKIKETFVNRVRAFSVGSRIKNTRTSVKPSPKLFNSDSIKNNSIENKARKSNSVPILINKSDKSDGQMGDLMEIDFSKPLKETISRKIQNNNNECQIPIYIPQNISNSVESMERCTVSRDKGYLEMKPLSFDSNSFTFTENNITTIPVCNYCQNNIKEESIGNHNKTKDVVPLNTNLIKTLRINNKCCPLMQEACGGSKTGHNDNPTDEIQIKQSEEHFPNQDLYYASLDLPKCTNIVTDRYNCKGSLSEANNEETNNDYAKISFNHPEISSSSLRKKC